MNGFEHTKKWVILAVLLLVVASSASAQLPGAIFTTTQHGTRVNANQYQEKCGSLGVWLDGGPPPNAPQGAAGLPDGDYYFQVTDPSGKVLLSTDPVVNRQFHVTDGIITGTSGLGNHNTDSDIDHPPARTIELCAPGVPFNDTPNNGGVYKAWVTPVGSFVGDPTIVDNGYKPGYFHGFIPASSKVDNFKVKGTAAVACMAVSKFIDANGNGIMEPALGEIHFGGWGFTVIDPLGAQIDGKMFTIAHLKDCYPGLFNLVPGKYTIIEDDTDGTGTFIVTANFVDDKPQNPVDTQITVTFKANDLRHDVTFGNKPQ